MISGPYEKVPLTDDDKEMLRTIYDTRRRLLLCAYAVLIALAFACSRRGLDYRSRYYGPVHHWEETEDASFISRNAAWLASLCFLEIPVIATGIFFLYRKVLPLKKDADSGLKDKIPYLVVRKEYFPLTSQYYVALDDPDYMHHEIDEDTYNQVCEGDKMYLYRATRSKYVFEMNGKFTVM